MADYFKVTLSEGILINGSDNAIIIEATDNANRQSVNIDLGGGYFAVYVNGKKLTNLPLEPIIFNDRALVPVREIFEAMGATVDYEASDKSIDITHGKTTVYLKIDSPIAKVNGVKKNIPDNVAPKLIAKWGESAKTMVPVRFISESIGMDVEFSERDGLISITDPNMTVAPTNTLKKITFFEDSDIVQIRISAKNAIYPSS